MSVKRRRIDPNNKWSDLEPLTEEQLVEHRKKMTKRSEFDPEYYTCDQCQDRYVCPLVFDLYNTDGDCLASK